jgi:cell division protein FtsB
VCAKRGRAPKQAVPEECKDAKYLARRLKNTAAAAANRAFHREAKRREKARLAALTATRRDLLAELATLRAQWPALCAAVQHHLQI